MVWDAGPERARQRTKSASPPSPNPGRRRGSGVIRRACRRRRRRPTRGIATWAGGGSAPFGTGLIWAMPGVCHVGFAVRAAGPPSKSVCGPEGCVPTCGIVPSSLPGSARTAWIADAGCDLRHAPLRGATL